MNKKVKKAIIPAAGLGTRFLPATKSIPKEMFPIVDKPTIQLIVEEAVKSGIEEILIIVSQYKTCIVDHFDYFFELEERLKANNKKEEYEIIRNIGNLANIYFIRQKEPLGLGDAILSAQAFINDEPFAVLLGDDVIYSEKNQKPAMLQCIEAYEKISSSVVGVQKIKKECLNRYGIVDIESINNNDETIFKLKGMCEKPSINEAPSDYAILGRYVLSPKIFDILKENSKKLISGELELTSALIELNKNEPIFAKVFDGKRYDIGSKLGYIMATIDEGLRNKGIHDDLIEYIKSILKNNE